MPIVKKGVIKTKIPEKNVQRYLDNGWELDEQKKEEPSKSYDDYTKKQLIDLAEERKITLKERMTKKEMIERLSREDKKTTKRPTNDGFTDNLIK